MENNVYRANVFKTLSIKPAKLGLKYVSHNTNRTNIMHAAIGLMTEAGELVECLAPYILGASRLSEKMKVEAFGEMGDIGYYLMVLSKALKIKLPTSSKKVRLKGMTRSAAILDVLRLSSGIANLSKKIFYGPVMVESNRDKTVKVLNEDGSVASTSVVTEKYMAIDAEKTLGMFSEREAKVVEYMTDLVPLYWALCYDMFEVPPSFVFVANIAKLSKRYGEGFFQLSEAESRDLEEEQEALAVAATS